jgi:hypothetical protein
LLAWDGGVRVLVLAWFNHVLEGHRYLAEDPFEVACPGRSANMVSHLIGELEQRAERPPGDQVQLDVEPSIRCSRDDYAGQYLALVLGGPQLLGSGHAIGHLRQPLSGIQRDPTELRAG